MYNTEEHKNFILEYYALREKYSHIFPDRDEWVEIPTASHPVRPWCLEELCRCGNAAAHKIEETTGASGVHPYTAYVCCDCFFGHCVTIFV